MSDPAFFGSRRVAILGLGLMGGSLALALDGVCSELRVYDPNPETIALAREMGIGEVQSTSREDVIDAADILILAAPIRGILKIIASLPDLHPGSPIVLDIGSTKTGICTAYNALPERFQAVGGHPMCGVAAAGLSFARRDLYREAAFAFIAVERTTSKARECAEALAGLLGAKPLWMNAVTHDAWVAATSHVPYLLSLALTLATPDEAGPLVGPGFASTSRLAGSSGGMMLDILTSNSENILAALEQFTDTLKILEAGIKANDPSILASMMARGAQKRATLVDKNTGGAS